VVRRKHRSQSGNLNDNMVQRRRSNYITLS
jgi:hypothetical protein